MLRRILAFLTRQPRALLAGLAGALFAAVAALDYVTGPAVLFLTLYFVPIFFATWFISRPAGFAAAVASGAAWLGVNTFSPASYLYHPFFGHLNVFLKLFSLLVFGYLIAELKSALDREAKTARTDYLTGVPNRRAFYEIAGAEIAKARRYARPFSVGYLDIDDFKDVNDFFGHSAGNDVLKRLALECSRSVRAHDALARLGGDEFGFFFPETGPDSARAISERLRGRVLEALSKGPQPVTFSMGLVSFVRPPADVDEVMKLIDSAMYAAKRAGKNRIHAEVAGAPGH
jgi:diguanylate cyclase (GGDEF)-like protein